MARTPVADHIYMGRLAAIDGVPQPVEPEDPALLAAVPSVSLAAPTALPDNPTFEDLVAAVRELQAKP